ncbi:Bax inhibitor-1/YccA family protein [Desulfosarcina sp. OttesenSCG-928-G10]|nr:Bax inhibitor-1/YccA family protein [Desulfosarcina sp. OttesenSCG-928-G10]MDL2321983.1 Bax inhibitor-1/YccA family protein [Desulfosarcina sp. OttesenSCG-928-B08]
MRGIIIEKSQAQVVVNNFMMSVYNWMAMGLVLTGGVAWFVAHNEPMKKFVYSTFLLFCIVELALVFILSGRIHKLKASTATAMFLAYSILNGATLCYIFDIYAKSSIFSTFFICAGTFAVCSVFGWTTKRDLTGMGQFLFMGVLGLIIASVVNIFLRSSGMQMIISYVGVLLFTALTAYDTQKLKAMALSQPEGLEAAVVRKGAIIGALALYLDFILMFQYLLQIFGGSRD